MPICKTSIAKHKTWNLNLLISLIYLCSSPAHAARSLGPFLRTLWSRPVSSYLRMAPVSSSLSHIFVPHPGPVALFRTHVLYHNPKKVSRAAIWVCKWQHYCLGICIHSPGKSIKWRRILYEACFLVNIFTEGIGLWILEVLRSMIIQRLKYALHRFIIALILKFLSGKMNK